MLDEINETFGGRRSHGFRILVVGGKPWGENVCQRNPIVTNDGNILRDSQPRLPDGVQAAQGGKIIRNLGYPLESLAIVESMDASNGTIVFREQEQ